MELGQRLDRELTRQEEVLATLQHQVDNSDASEADCLEVRGRIVDLWDRLENYVSRNYRQRLFREGDLSGLIVNAHLREHLRVINAAPQRTGETQIQKYLNGLRLPHLTAAQVEDLEGEV
ncbi:hypothetical protein NDU88_001046 [Pleurodeles waltl]|uniref:Uncharacterized protein n=1 Tax=Pleurodeles waltl TaxID=8319 RepID=A0AAV7TH61_PLEWA|nr:hypothetical protein NDU88_001046 [Pleurodeles waltl]